MSFPVPGPHSCRPLLDLLGRKMTPGDVAAIAAADYGQECDDHAEAIAVIARTGRIPVPMDWVPREVLTLTSYSEPADYIERERPAAHLRRAFACALVLIADANDGLGWSGENSTMAPLVESAQALGSDVGEAAAEFAAWLAPRVKEPRELPFIGLAFVALAMPDPSRWPDTLILEACHWVMTKEDEAAAPWRSTLGLGSDQSWLLPITNFDGRHGTWRKIGAGLEERAREAGRGGDVIELAALFGAMLAD
jgi:hypothetical protein